MPDSKQKSSTNHLGDDFEEVLQYMFQPFKKIAQYFDYYLKTAELTDSEREFVKSYKIVIDNMTAKGLLDFDYGI